MTRSEIIELMARSMFPTVYDDARSKWQVTQRERKGTAYNKANAALDAIAAAGLAIVPIEPSGAMIDVGRRQFWVNSPENDLDEATASAYRAMIVEAIKEQEVRD